MQRCLPTQKITKSDASEDALLTESALLGPDNPKNAGGGGKDEQFIKWGLMGEVV